MQQVLDVNILEDSAIQKTIMYWALPATIAGLVLAGVGTGRAAADAGVGPALLWFSWFVVLYLASMPVHELVHALFFKIFGPAGTRVIFGFKNGMLYAGCPGLYLPRAQFAVTLLAPFVLLTLVYAAVGIAFHAPLLAWCLFFLHTGGCAGDFYIARVLVRHPEADLCEDTTSGVTLWRSR